MEQPKNTQENIKNLTSTPEQKPERAPFTWHYYFMAFGILMALLAMTLSAWGSAIAAVGFAFVFLPNLLFKFHTRIIFAVLFAVVYVMGFPPAETVIQMMSVKQ